MVSLPLLPSTKASQYTAHKLTLSGCEVSSLTGLQKTFNTFPVHQNQVSCFRLKLEEQVGEGAFGRVMRATATGIGNKNDPLTVAVKMLKGELRQESTHFKIHASVLELR